MAAVLVVLGLTFVGCVTALVAPRARPRSRVLPDEPLSDVADRVLAQLRSLPETREREKPEQG
jgi:hypothetical protein